MPKRKCGHVVQPWWRGRCRECDTSKTTQLDRVTTFFYLLMRDRLPTGTVEETMNVVRDLYGKPVFSSPELEDYARSLALELLGMRV